MEKPSMFIQVSDLPHKQIFRSLAHYLQSMQVSPKPPKLLLHWKGASKVDNEFSEKLNRSQMELIDVNKIWNGS